jgi:Leucine-rich repeat (LRR) protein
MHYLPAIYITFLGFVVLIVECNVVNVRNEIDNVHLDCSKFKRDLDVLRSFSYSVQLNPLITTGKTYAIMNSDSQVEELSIYHQTNLPLDVFCLIHLHTLRVNSTPFVSQFQFDDDIISIGLSPLISRLNQLRVLSLINTRVSYIPPQALAVLTNITILEIDNCGLREIPPTISFLTNLQELRLPNNDLHSIPQNTALQQMSKLKYLDLSHNKIKDITDLAEIASREVSTIDLSYNEIDFVPPEISQFYYELYYLYLNDNKLTYIPTDVFELVYLQKADFQRNAFPADEITAIKARFQSAISTCIVTI